MSSPALPPKYRLNSWQKKDEQASRIPDAWLLPRGVDTTARNLQHVPRTCGLLTTEELRITEDFDATGLAEAVRRRELRCVDVARAFCKRAAIAHQLTNCLTEIFFQDALQHAAYLDTHLDAGKPPLGPLHGVPISLKDTFKVKGYDSSIGISALCFKPASENAALVDVLLAAGAVLYCKTNVPQTLMALDSHNNIFGRTLNPLNTALTAGGSSGGEGALLGLRGSILGVGTDVGGSIRVPAMCQGLFGVKPSCGRVPYAGQEDGGNPGVAKLSLSASAGPMAHSARDVELFFKAVSGQRPWQADPDVVPGSWDALSSVSERKLRIGVVRRDGVMEPHPPISRLLDEVARKMKAAGIEVVDIDIAPLLSQCQSLANGFFSVEGANSVFDLIEAHEEPLSPWLQTRLRRKEPVNFDKLRDLQARRTALQKKFLSIWNSADEKGVDAFICPIAPHPVPEIDRYNGTSYTSAFVLLDYAAGVIPVRSFQERDMKGEMPTGAVLGSWDKRNRELWTDNNRPVYLGSPLCVQVVAPRLEERRLCNAMSAIDNALKAASQAKL